MVTFGHEVSVNKLDEIGPGIECDFGMSGSFSENQKSVCVFCAYVCMSHTYIYTHM